MSASGHSSASSEGLLATLFIVTAIVAVFSIVVLWKVFVKAGRPGWAAIIPIYNTWVLFEIAGKPGWWALIAIVPYLGSVIFLVLYILAMLDLAKRFGKDTVFAVVGLIIFSIIGLAILAFGDAKYEGPSAPTQGASPPVPPKPPVASQSSQTPVAS